MSISERVKLLCEHAGSQVKLSAKTGVTNATISKIVSKGGNARSDTLEAILKAYPNLSARWLLTGEGPMWEYWDEDYPPKVFYEPGNEEQLRQMKQQLQMVGRMNELLEQRLRAIEREIARQNPELAQELGISI
jgi:DNA-binding Xre family transcriptional regulator